MLELREMLCQPSIHVYPHWLAFLKEDLHGVYEVTTDNILDKRDIEYFTETFGIIGIHPVFTDHSGFIVWMLDNHGFMYWWNGMEQAMDYTGGSLMEGLTNHIYHPGNICAIMENAAKLVHKAEQLKHLAEKVAEE